MRASSIKLVRYGINSFGAKRDRVSEKKVNLSIIRFCKIRKETLSNTFD
jgi:hypothetical protein